MTLDSMLLTAIESHLTFMQYLFFHVPYTKNPLNGNHGLGCYVNDMYYMNQNNRYACICSYMFQLV